LTKIYSMLKFEHHIVNPKSNTMKKFFFIFILGAFFASAGKADAQTLKSYPIPSYNVIVNGFASFQEYQNGGTTPSDKKKTIRVATTSLKSLSTFNMTVFAYSLDRQDRLGPFYITAGEDLSIAVDDRDWGLLIKSENEAVVDVWIEGSGIGLLGRSGHKQ